MARKWWHTQIYMELHMIRVPEFEKQFAEYYNVRDAVVVNSPYSANLLMMAMLEYKYLVNGSDKRYFKGDIVVPSICQPHTFLPIHQMGFRLNIVDVDVTTLNIDPYQLMEYVTPHTRAIVVTNTLGVTADTYRIRQVAKENDIMLVEDVTTAFGAIADSDEYCGTIGQFGTFEIAGMGVITCRTQDDANWLRSLRNTGLTKDWAPDDKWYKNGKGEKKWLRSGQSIKDDNVVLTPGFGVSVDRQQADTGLKYLKNWPRRKEQMVNNADYFKTVMKGLNGFKFQREKGYPVYNGFSMICQNEMKGRRTQVIEALNTIPNVVVKPIYSNILEQPVLEYINHISNGIYYNAKQVHEEGFYIENPEYDFEQKIDEIFDELQNLEKDIIRSGY